MSDKNDITRRDMLAMTGAALAGSSLYPGSAFAETEDLPQVPRRVLGRTGKEVPILLLGGGGGFDMRFDPKIAEALRYGVNYLDVADCYHGGTCETAVGNFHMKLANRESLWITSKSDAHDPKGFERVVETSLKKLQTDFIDLYFLHNLEAPGLLTDGLKETVASLKASGKIRHFGFSCHGPNVVELLHKAAETPWVEAVMFRYNFRQYGDAKLQGAIDAAHKAGVGLIAMKTQGSEASFADAWKSFEKTGKWTKHQAVLKAVWADKRISAVVSAMDNFDKLRQNIAAALDTSALGAREIEALDRYAAATRSLACDGCDHLCNPAVDADVRIGDTLRHLMYHDVYGETGKARESFAALPAPSRAYGGVDFSGAEAACPHGVKVGQYMERALRVLA